MGAYGKCKCGLCGQVITHNGLSMVSHIRTHVRSGELEEFTFTSLTNGVRKGLCFKPTNGGLESWSKCSSYF